MTTTNTFGLSSITRFLLVDYVRRWWFLFAVASIPHLMMPMAEMAHFACAMALLLGPVVRGLDMGIGAERVYRRLPISRTMLARILWIEGVLGMTDGVA